MTSRLALCLAAAALLARPALADDASAATTSASGQPEMTAEQKAEMEAWEAAAKPGKEHAALEPIIGSFDTKVTSWMAAGQPPEVSTGHSENRFILGDRWVEQRFKGEFMGQPFEGIGYTGYDNVKKAYVGSWMDSMSTTMMTSSGTADAAGTKFTFTGECSDPMSGKAQHYRQVMTIEGPNKHVFEMWTNDKKTGQEYKAMELVYTRAGSAQND